MTAPATRTGALMTIATLAGVLVAPASVARARQSPADAAPATTPAAAPAAMPATAPATTPEPAALPPAAAEPGPPTTTYRLDAEGQWVPVEQPEPGSDAAVMARARAALADDRPETALTLLNDWIDRNSRTASPFLPEAYVLRGDALSASGSEFDALYDYETVIKTFPGTPQYVLAVERELEIAVRYVGGLRRKFLGIRFIRAFDVGEELLVRVQERLPGSRLAERAGIELADHYYRTREMELAAEAYELFLENYPRSVYRERAMQRRIYASLSRFKGPRYDSSPLVDARVLIERFQAQYPAAAAGAGLDEALLTRVDESAALQLLESARWYLRVDDPVSARLTLRRLVAAHPRTAAAGVALDTLVARGWLPPAPTTTPATTPAPEATPEAAPAPEPTPEPAP